ncbi:MAG: hypothetical protein AUH94_00335 [Ktedonobacter sp. 13_2_20CM_2_54_8]|nr:MAG: hypothetical protein AUH94_00335 [Ktedonobacter sp. 13_2_20CM_2_54_8]
MEQSASPSLGETAVPRYAVGIDIGSESCSFCTLKSDKRVVIKPTAFANAASGFVFLTEKLEALGVSAHHILIGLEATSRYGENLYHFLQSRGYRIYLLHPRQTHQFAQQRGLRAKTDKLDASTIARVLLSGEARPGYVPDDLIATYRELARLHTQSLVMKWHATRTKFNPCSPYSFPNLRRSKPLPAELLLSLCSNSTQVLKHSQQLGSRRLLTNCMNWLLETMG